jgi:cytochrome c-type biogenesis protein CcmH
MKRKLFLLLLIGVAAVSLFLVVNKVSAQEPKPTPSDDEVLAVAKKLYCPVCPNTPLDVCETQACQDWRAQIKDQLSQGWTEQQIIDYFVAQYGERVLAEPERTGFTSLVWVLPIIAALLGCVIVWQVLRNWKSQNANPAPVKNLLQGISPETLARIEKELKEME